MNAPITRRLPVALALLTLCGPAFGQAPRPPHPTAGPTDTAGLPPPQTAAPKPPAPGAAPPDASPWTALANTAPDSISTMLLLTDGTVMAQGYGGTHEGDSAHWYKLTPDNTGSYVNGTWTTLTDMNHSRLFFASAVMKNGKVFVAGGEYSDNQTSTNGDDTNTAEIYDPLANDWAVISGPGWSNVGDAPITALADGDHLLMGNINSQTAGLYDIAADSWATGGKMAAQSDEESWALLPDNSVLTVDCNGQPTNGPDAAERYLPASNTWVTAGSTPAGHNVVEASSQEIGPALLLPNGNVFFAGATGHTALYSTTSTSGSPWLAGPDLPNVLDGSGNSVTAQCKDAPGVLEVNGKVLFIAGPTGSANSGYPGNQYFFEYDPNGGGNGTIASVASPGGSVSGNAAFEGRMLPLPNGQVLFSNYGNQLYAYQPSSGPDSSWAPAGSYLYANTDGSYTLGGTQFNGLSQASAYGDDVSSATNYPLVRFIDGSGNVNYGRTYNHSTMGVATGGATVSTTFTASPYLTPGNYTLQIVANGISSPNYAFASGCYVNAAAAGSSFQFGSKALPFATVNQGVNAAQSGGLGSYVFIQGGDYNEQSTISKAVTLVSDGGGSVSIGS